MAVRVRGWGWGRASRQSCRRRCEKSGIKNKIKIKPVFTAAQRRCEITPFMVSRFKALVMYLALCYLRALMRLLSPLPHVEEEKITGNLVCILVLPPLPRRTAVWSPVW